MGSDYGVGEWREFPYSAVLGTTTLTWTGAAFDQDHLTATFASGAQAVIDLGTLTPYTGAVTGSLNGAVFDGSVLPGSNGALAGWTAKLTLATHDNSGAARSLDVYFTKTAASAWQVVAYDSSTAHAGSGFPYASGPARRDDAGFRRRRIGHLGRDAQPSAGANGHDMVLDLSALHQGGVTDLHYAELATSTLTTTTIDALPDTGAALLATGGGTVLLGGASDFAGGVSIAAGTTLELGSSGNPGVWGSTLKQYTITTVNSVYHSVTLDVYVAPVPNGFEVTVYDHTAASVGGGFPYRSGPLSVTTIGANDSGTALSQNSVVTTVAGGTVTIALDPSASQTQGLFLDTSVYQVMLVGNLPTGDALYAASGASSVSYWSHARVVEVGSGYGGTYQNYELRFVHSDTNSWTVGIFNGFGSSIQSRINPLATKTVTFNADGSIASGGSISIPGASFAVSLADIVQGSGAFSVDQPELALRYHPTGASEDVYGPLPSVNLGGGMAAGSGAIHFDGANAALIVDAGAPANALIGFAIGDTIQLRSAAGTARTIASDANGVLHVAASGGGTLDLNLSDLAPFSPFAISPLTGGGATVRLLQSVFAAPSPAALTAAFAAINSGGSSAASGAAYAIAGYIGTGYDASLSTAFGATTLTLTGETLTLSGSFISTVAQGATGLDLITGTVLLDGAGLYGGASGLGGLFTVEAGAQVVIGSKAASIVSGGVSVAAGGSLILETGSVGGTLAAGGDGLRAAPKVGETLEISAAIAGTLHVGAAGGVGGLVLRDAPGATVAALDNDSVVLDGAGTFELASGARAASIRFASAAAILKVDDPAPRLTLSFDQSVGAIDLAGVAPPAGVSQVAVDASGNLTIGAAVLHITAGAPAGTLFTVSPDGAGGTRVAFANETLAIHNSDDFSVLAGAVAALPSGAGVTLTADLSAAGSTLTITADDSSSAFRGMPSGDAVHLIGATAIDVAAGADAVIGGDNSFTGGVTIEDGAIVELVGATSGGTGAIRFNGTGGVLRLDAAVAPSNAILGMTPDDAIHLAGFIPSATMPTLLRLDYDHHLTVPGATGNYTLSLPDLLPGTAVAVVPDGAGGIVLHSLYAAETIPVATIADLVAAITHVNTLAIPENVKILIAAGAHLVLSDDLPAIALVGAGAVVIDGQGATIDGAGLYRGIFAYSGTITLANLTIAHTLAKGGDGGDGDISNGGGGGGGAGLGGALFVASAASVQLAGVSFADNRAVGGAGGTSVFSSTIGSGGGGGLGGDGGDATPNRANPDNTHSLPGAPGGGGGIGVDADGATGYSAIAGTGDLARAGGGGAGAGGGLNPGVPQQVAQYLPVSGVGGFGGGGGGGLYSGGAGGFGGGGGGGRGGDGGFGGGGGSNANGGWGAGTGSTGYAGGGAGLGGAVFVQTGGSITFLSGNTQTSGAAAGGVSTSHYAGVQTDGLGLGAGLFVQGDNTITFAGDTVVAGDLTDMTSHGGSSGALSVAVTGGTVELDGNDAYAGATTIAAGATLILKGSIAALTGGLIDDGTLVFAQTGDTSYGSQIFGTGTLTKQGGGTLSLTAGTTTRSVIVSGGTLALGGDVSTVTRYTDNAALVLTPTNGLLAGAVAGSGTLTIAPTIGGTVSSAIALTGATTLRAGGTGTTYTGTISTGALTLGGGVTLSGDVHAAGAIAQTAGTLTLSGNVVADGAVTLSGASGATIGGTFSAAGDITLGGSAGYAVTGRLSTAGTLAVTGSGTTTIAGDVSASVLRVSAGTVSFSDVTRSIGSVILSGGTTFAGGSTALGRGTIGFAADTSAYSPTANTTLVLAPGATPVATISGFNGHDAIDIRGIGAPVGDARFDATTGQLTVRGSTGTVALAFDPNWTIPTGYRLWAHDDMAGGTTLQLAPTSFTSLSALAAIDTGGLYATANAAALRIAATVNTSTSGTVDLRNGDTLAIDFSSTSGTSGGAHLTFVHGATTLSGTLWQSDQAPALTITSGATVRLAGLSLTERFDGATGIVVADGATLSVDPLGGTETLTTAIAGPGRLVLDGAGTLLLKGVDSYHAASTFSGGIVIRAGALELGDVTAGGTGTISFTDGVASTLTIDHLRNTSAILTSVVAGFTVAGFASDDAIVLGDIPYYSYGSPYAPSATLSASGVLTVKSGGTFTVQLDPGRSYAGYAPVLSAAPGGGTRITLQPTGMVVHTGAELAAAIAAINAGGARGASNTAYTITLANDLTGASGLAASLPALALQPGSSLTIVGNGHSIDGGGAAALLNAVSQYSGLTLDHLTLLNGGAGGTAGGALALGFYASAKIIGGSIGGGAGALGTTGSGVSLDYGALTLATAAGETLTIADRITGLAYGGAERVNGEILYRLSVGQVIVAGAGTVVLSAANDLPGGISLQSGTLELAAQNAAGTRSAALGDYSNIVYTSGGLVTFGGNGVLKVDPGVTGFRVTGLSPGVGAIDFVNVAPASLTTSAVANRTVIDGVQIDGKLVVVSDGAGGSLAYQAVTNFAAASAADLRQDLFQIAPGGANAALGAPFSIQLASGTLSTATGVAPIDLTAGSTLALNGGSGGTTLDGTGDASGLVISHGTVALSGISFANYGTGHPALTLGSGAGGTVPQMTISSGGFGTGAELLVTGGQTVAVQTAAGQTISFGGAIDDDGGAAAALAQAGGGTLRLAAAGDFRGGVTVSGILDLAATGAAGSGTITLGGASQLRVESGVTVANTIAGLSASNSVDLVGFAADRVAFSGGTLTLWSGASSTSLSLAGVSAGAIKTVSDGAGGTLVSLVGARQVAGVDFTHVVDLGAVHVGDTVSRSLAIRYTGSGTEQLVFVGNGLTGPITASGDVGVLAPGGSTNETLSWRATASGPLTAGGTPSFVSHADGLIDTAARMVQPSFTVTGTAYAYAAPQLSTHSIDFGAVRVGTTTAANLTLAQTASPYRESFAFNDTGLAAPFATSTASGSASASATLGVSFAPTISGTYSGTLGVALTSLGSAGLANTALAGQSVSVTGKAYATAVAQTAGAVDFGIVHVGDTAARTLAIANGASGDLVDHLVGTLASTGDAFRASGMVDLAAGTATSFNVSANTATAGVFTGTVSYALASHDGDLADKALTTAATPLSITVDNYAQAALSAVSGGTLVDDGNGRYHLDLGLVSASTGLVLKLANMATGQADQLGATYSISGNADFVNSRFGAFTGVAAGTAKSGMTVTVNPVQSGDVSETITINPYGTNASGYHGDLAPIVLTLTAHVFSNQFTVHSATELGQVLAQINEGGVYAQANTAFTINLDPAGSYALTSDFAAIDLASGASLTIDGAGATLSGGDTHHGFFVLDGSVALQNMMLTHFVARGGDGGSSGTYYSGYIGTGGGGAGLGGALFVVGSNPDLGLSGASVTLDGVSFADNAAVGGNAGGSGTAGSGGSLDGGVSGVGSFGAGATSASASGGFGGGGAGGFFNGAVYYNDGGSSAFGGGAGAGGQNGGGWGGGSASTTQSATAGGGLGAGADIFVQAGGQVTVRSGTLGAGTVLGGSGGLDPVGYGAAHGATVFLQGGQTLALAPITGSTITIAGGIDDQGAQGAGRLSVGGAGTVRITAASGYVGGTDVSSILELGATGAAGSGAITLQPGATLILDAGVNLANEIDGLASGGTIDVIGLTAANAKVSGHVLTLVSVTQSLSLTLGGALLSNYALVTADDGHGGTRISYIDGTGSRGLATAQVPTTIDLGAHHVGDAVAVSVSVANTALQGGDMLGGGFGAVTGPFTGAGSLAVAPGASGDLTLSVDTGRDGATAGSASYALTSLNGYGADGAVTAGTTGLSATIYSYAAPRLSAPSIALGAARVGDAALTGSVTLTNGIVADAYQEALGYRFDTLPAGVTVGGASGTVASGAQTALDLHLATATSGVVGGTVAIDLTSKAGAPTLSDTALPALTLGISGTVYQTAQASLSRGTIDFGIVHVGDTVSTGVTVTNSATGALVDRLQGSFAGTPSGIAASGAVDLASGDSGTLTLALDTAHAATIDGAATLAFASHDGDLADVTVAATPVTVHAVVDNYAIAGLSVAAGNGTLTHSGNAWTLDLGAVDATSTVTLTLSNAASGPTDLLSGSFDQSGAATFTNAGLGDVTGLVAGAGRTITVSLAALFGGEASESIVFHGIGSNASGYSASIGDTTLTVRATVTHGTAPVLTVHSEAELNAAIAQVSSGGAQAAGNTSYTILIDAGGNPLRFDDALRAITLLGGSSLTVDGQGATLDGEDSQRGFAVLGGTVTLKDLSLTHMLAQGGAATTGYTGDIVAAGGGGAGLGGALFVAAGATAVLNGVDFASDRAIGGQGGNGSSEGFYRTSGAGGGMGGDASPYGDPGAGLFGGTGFGRGAGPDQSGSFGAGAGGSSFNTTVGGFGGGGGGSPSGYSVAGFGGGAGSSFGYNGGGGLGAGGDVFVQAGGTLVYQSGAMSAGSATGGAAGSSPLGSNEYQAAQAGQGLGGSIFLGGGDALVLAPKFGETVSLAGEIADMNGTSRITVNGPGTVALDASSAGLLTILQGTLTLTGRDDGATVAIANNGVLRLADTTNGYALAASPTARVATIDVHFTFGGVRSFAVGGSGTLADAADAINAAHLITGVGAGPNSYVYLTATYDAAIGKLSVSDAYGGYYAQPIDANGSAIPVSYGPVLDPADAILVNGVSVTVGGTGTLLDLVSAINAAAIGDVRAGVDIGSAGGLALTSANGPITLADAHGTPLETLGLTAGSHGANDTVLRDIRGAGAVVVDGDDGAVTSFDAAVAWTGATTIAAHNTVIFRTDTAALTGAIDDGGVLELAAPVDTTLSAAIGGTGSVIVGGDHAVRLTGANSFAGGLTLTGGTLVLANAASAGVGAIHFAGAATLELAGGVDLPNAVTGFVSGDAIVLDGIDAASAAITQGANGSFRVSDAAGHSASLTIVGGAAGQVYATSAVAGGVRITASAPDTLIDLPARSVATGSTAAGSVTVSVDGKPVAIDATAATTILVGTAGVLALHQDGSYAYYAQPGAVVGSDAFVFHAADGSIRTLLVRTAAEASSHGDATPLAVTAAEYRADQAAFASLANADGSAVPISVVDTGNAFSAVDLAAMIADPAVMAITLSGGTIAIGVDDLVALGGIDKIGRVTGGHAGLFDVSGTGADVAVALDALHALGAVATVTVTDYRDATFDAGALARDADVVALIVRDGAPLSYNVVGSVADVFATWNALSNDARVLSIAIVDTAAHLSDEAVLGRILANRYTTLPNGAGFYAAHVSDGSAVTASANTYFDLLNSGMLQDGSGNIYTRFDVYGTATDIGALIGYGGSAAPLSLTVTDDVPLPLTVAQWHDDAAQVASVVRSSGAAVTVALIDTPDHLRGAIVAGQIDASVVTMAFSGIVPGTSPTLTMTVGQLATAAAALAKLTSPFSLAVTGAAAADVSSLIANQHVASIAVSDSAAHLTPAVLDALTHVAATVTVTPDAASDGFLHVSVADFTRDAAVLAHVSYAGATISRPIAVVDTAANIAAAFDAIAASSVVGRILISDNAPVVLTLAQYTADTTARAIVRDADGGPVGYQLVDANGNRLTYAEASSGGPKTFGYAALSDTPITSPDTLSTFVSGQDVIDLTRIGTLGKIQIVHDAGGSKVLFGDDGHGGYASEILVAASLTASDVVTADPQQIYTMTSALVGDTLLGHAGADRIVASGAGATVAAGAGDDTITVASGANTVDGGDGNDTLVLSGESWRYAVTQDGNAVTLSRAGETDRIVNVETIAFADRTMSLADVLAQAANHHVGGVGNDTLVASGSAPQIFDLSAGGDDTATGGPANDGFYFGAALTGADHVDGGAGTNDQIGLQGDYTGSHALVLQPGTITGIETIAVLPCYAYDITTVDANVDAGQVLTIYAAALGAGDALIFNGSAETNGMFRVFGGLGADDITTGAGNDGIYFGAGRFNPATDHVDGGAGTNDQMALDGTYTGLTIARANVVNVEMLVLLDGQPAPVDYSITLADDWTQLGEVHTVYAVTVRNGVTVDGHFESDAALRFYGGQGADTLIGGAFGNWFDGGAGGDTMTGGAGVDAFYYGTAATSTSTSYDRIVDFDPSQDKIDTPNAITGIDAVTTGTLSTATFDADLTAALATLGANHAVQFTATGGTLAAHVFEVVDVNGVAGYQAGQDLVIELVTPHAPITTLAPFI